MESRSQPVRELPLRAWKAHRYAGKKARLNLGLRSQVTLASRRKGRTKGTANVRSGRPVGGIYRNAPGLWRFVDYCCPQSLAQSFCPAFHNRVSDFTIFWTFHCHEEDVVDPHPGDISTATSAKCSTPAGGLYTTIGRRSTQLLTSGAVGGR